MLYRPDVGAGEELHRLARALAMPQPFLLLATLYKAPEKPQDGMIVKADGTQWNPGSGAGYYGYTSGSWSFLG
jgi:hypothetical protein